MKIADLRHQQRLLLQQRLAALARIRRGLAYTLGHLQLPIQSTEHLDDATLEALAALNERFGKLQDLLAATMKQVTLLASEPAETFPQTLSFLYKVGVVDDIEGWQTLRLLRNIGAHEYDTDSQRQAEYFVALVEAIPTLESVADRLIAYVMQQTP